MDSAITCRLEGVIPVDRPIVDSGRVGTECSQEFGGSLNVKPEAWCCREVWGWQHGSGLGGGGERGDREGALLALRPLLPFDEGTDGLALADDAGGVGNQPL